VGEEEGWWFVHASQSLPTGSASLYHRLGLVTEGSAKQYQIVR
jgi:hypothetical protein